ncbi:FadR family transcriptional regulator [Microbacterium sp. Sa4CUA7]|uniref:FadR family transcriptional regulator n=1 Tax=Microbacterium pullorum TaxID=2762236 RepID=A0ABR8S2R6_9MICO|nr:FadR/GntR family transcriptional regulator [Microbacterium pullorum]MBD7957735.1 FadR family transcriptional regulator [Microbacterium pullorum]
MTLDSTPPTRVLGEGARTPAKRLGVVVVHDLVAAIVTGEVAPGDLLPTESELSNLFGVSRTVIRESIKRIEEKGMVRVVQGRGTEVTAQRSWNILDHVVLSTLIENDATLGVLDEVAVLRAELESVMARDAAERRTESAVEDLHAAMARMHAAMEDPTRFGDEDIAFHEVVMKMSGHIIARGIAQRLVDEARENSARFRIATPEAHRLTVEEHQQILDAIVAGDEHAAATAMRTHIAASWERRRTARSDEV